MTLLVLALLAGFIAATGIVLADSGLRLWSAFGGIARQKALLDLRTTLPTSRPKVPARVLTRVSYERAMPSPRRAAA